MQSSLYEIEARYHQALGMLYDDDVPDCVAIDTLEAVEGEMEAKAEAYAAIIGNLDAEIEAIKADERRQASRRRAKEGKAAALRLRLLDAMVSGGVPKFDTPRFRIAVRTNPESVVILDESAIPTDYKREVPAHYEADKSLIKAAIKDGFDVPGVRVERTKRLDIK